MITTAQMIKQFWHDFNQFINAGFPVYHALNATLVGYPEDSILGMTIKQVTDDIKSGSMLSEALGKHRNFFGRLEINLIRAGEVGGMLEIVSSRLVRDSIPTKPVEYKNFYATLAACVSSGVPILTSFKIAKDYCKDGLRDDVEKIITEIQNGESISMAMAQSNLFSRGEIAIIDHGEEVGNLDYAFKCLADLC